VSIGDDERIELESVGLGLTDSRVEYNAGKEVVGKLENDPPVKPNGDRVPFPAKKLLAVGFANDTLGEELWEISRLEEDDPNFPIDRVERVEKLIEGRAIETSALRLIRELGVINVDIVSKTKDGVIVGDGEIVIPKVEER